MAGTLIADRVILPITPLVFCGLTLAGIGLSRSRARPICLPTLVFIAGAVNLTFHTAVLSPKDLRSILGIEPQLATIRGVLLETPIVRIYDQERQPFWHTQ